MHTMYATQYTKYPQKNNTHPVTKAWERIGKETKLMWWKLLQVLKFAQKAQFDIYDLT